MGRDEALTGAAALAGSAALVALGLRLAGGWESSPAAVAAVVSLPALAGILALLVAGRDAGPLRAAAAAGLGGGVLVGIAGTLATPAYWFSPDVAWHTAKVALAADGHPWQDPILRVRSFYPFTFHWLLAWPVRLGLPLRAVMTGTSAVALVGVLASFWWCVRGRVGPVPAAWATLALPLAFPAPLRGYMLLPSPANLSWAPLLVGTGLALRAGTTKPGCGAVAAGALLGLAGLLWYGHLPLLGLLVVLLAVSSRPLALRLVAGASLPAAIFALHVLSLSPGEVSGFVAPSLEGPLAERLAAMSRNALSLSGADPWGHAPWWIGLLAGAALAWSLRYPGDARGDRTMLPRMALAAGASLAAAGLLMRYWEPFSWRYAAVLWIVVLLLAASGRPWRIAGRSVPPTAALALLAVLLVPRWWLPVLQDTVAMDQLHEECGAEVSTFLEQHTAPDEPVFASAATWEHAIGCCTPRPNLVDRDMGTYKYAPPGVAAPRYRDYLAVVAAPTAAEARALLEPYGFRYAVIHVQDQARPGLAALARGYEPRLITRDYLVVDLDAPTLERPAIDLEGQPAAGESN